MVVCIITPGVKYAWSRGPCFLVTAQPAPHPRGHTPISQDGSIAPLYILFWKFEKSRVVKAFPVIELFIAIHTLPFWIINTDYASSEG